MTTLNPGKSHGHTVISAPPEMNLFCTYSFMDKLSKYPAYPLFLRAGIL